MSNNQTNIFKWLPSIEELLNYPSLQAVNINHNTKAECARNAVDRWRKAIRRDAETIRATFAVREIFVQKVLADALEECNKAAQNAGRKLHSVVNATGVVLHTNLGRAPFAQSAVEAVNDVITGYCNLETDLETGKRSDRRQNFRDHLLALTGAEDCLVVNNNAAAVLLALNTFAEGKKGVISRGQLVEIGGSFRVPEIMEKSGVKLVEIGTTNKTNINDYDRAIDEETGCVLIVHPSNFHISGFTDSPELEEIVAVAKEHGVTSLYDWGCGAIYPLAEHGIGSESNVKKIVASGVDVLSFSGDKLLGGPQCGIIVGKKEYIAKLAKNPLARALRPDKMLLAALEATLKLYLEPEKAKAEVPIINLLTTEFEVLAAKAASLAVKLQQIKPNWQISVETSVGQVGGGSLPEVHLPTAVIRINIGKNPEDLAHSLRIGEPSVVGYIKEQCLHFDMRSLLPGDEERILQACQKAAE